MPIHHSFKAYAEQVLRASSDPQSGNEALVQLYSKIMGEWGIKNQIQEVSHSHPRLSKRQFNIIGSTSDLLVDRTTRRGMLLVNPIDVTMGCGGDQNRLRLDDQQISGTGALQGRLDFLCRIFASVDLADQRHKTPVYLVGACGSHFGMVGSRFLLESLAVNPKEVVTFAPTQLQKRESAYGHLSYTVDVDSAHRERDAKGYNRPVEIEARGVSCDHAYPEQSVNAFELLKEVLLDATEAGFDFQWSSLSIQGAEGGNPDTADAKIYLTTFQYEDFRLFMNRALSQEGLAGRVRVEYSNDIGSGARFIPTELIEVVLELEHLWEQRVSDLNTSLPSSEPSMGVLCHLEEKGSGIFSVTFELRLSPDHESKVFDQSWKKTIQTMSESYSSFHFQMIRNSLIEGVRGGPSADHEVVRYLTDAGIFHQKKFPVSIVGVGDLAKGSKGAGEVLDWSELEDAIQYYQKLVEAVNA